MKSKALRAASLLLVAVMMLSSCTSGAEFESVMSAAESTNKIDKYTANFFVEIMFADGRATLSYMQGSYSIDRASERMYCVSSQTYLGSAAKVVEFYENGCLYNACGDTYLKLTQPAEDSFSTVVYRQIPVFDASAVKKLSTGENENGTMTSFSVPKGAESLMAELAGENIYTLASLSLPRKEMTRFGELECEYTLGKVGEIECIVSRQLQFNMFIYDTPPYAAGKTFDDEEFMLDLSIRVRIVITAAGDSVNVEIPSYDPQAYIETGHN